MNNFNSEDQVEFFKIKCSKIDDILEEAILIKKELSENEVYLEKSKSDMKIQGNRLNFYMNNIIDLDFKFDYKKHVIIIDDKDLCIYLHKDLKYLNFENTKDNIDNKKEMFRKKVPIKLIIKCLELVEDQNDIYIEYESCLEYKNDILADLEDIVDEVKVILTEGEQEAQSEVETFNSDIHEILLFEKNGEYDFIYVRKEMVEDFINYFKK